MKYFTNLKFSVWVCNPRMPVQMYFPVKILKILNTLFYVESVGVVAQSPEPEAHV